MAMRLSVCMFEVSVLSKLPGGLSWFCMGAIFDLSYTHKEIQISTKNKGTSLWNLFLNSRLREFFHGTSIAETCCQLTVTKVDAQSMINWTILGHLMSKFH